MNLFRILHNRGTKSQISEKMYNKVLKISSAFTGPSLIAVSEKAPFLARGNMEKSLGESHWA